MAAITAKMVNDLRSKTGAGTTDTEQGQKMIADLNKVCDKLKIAGTFAPHSEI